MHLPAAKGPLQGLRAGSCPPPHYPSASNMREGSPVPQAMFRQDAPQFQASSSHTPEHKGRGRKGGGAVREHHCAVQGDQFSACTLTYIQAGAVSLHVDVAITPSSGPRAGTDWALGLDTARPSEHPEKRRPTSNFLVQAHCD